MRSSHYLISCLFLTIGLGSIAQSASMLAVDDTGYTDSEGRIIDEISKNKIQAARSVIHDKKRTYVPTYEKKRSYNENFKILRDDKRIMTLQMNVDDVVKTTVCFNSPLRVVLGASTGDKISQAIVDDRIFSDPEVSKDERSVYVVMKQPIKKQDEVWKTGLRVIRQSDSRAYFFAIEMIACPPEEMDLPTEIVVNRKETVTKMNDQLLAPEDFITELSFGFPRKNKENILDVYDGIVLAGSEWQVLSISVKIGNPNKTRLGADIVFLDSLQIRELESSFKYIPISSKKVTDDTNVSTLRFTASVKVNKRYVMERNYIYMMFIDHEGKYYQYAKIPLKDLFEKKNYEGYELNIN